MSLPANKTKIVCTIGPASESQEVMEEMIRAGMNVARLNFSHGDFESHGIVIEKLRSAAQAVGRRLAIMADLPGPKMRIGQLDPEPIELKPGDPFALTTEDIVGDQTRASMTFSRLPKAVKPGDTLYINDGLIQLEVENIVGNDVNCKVVVRVRRWFRVGHDDTRVDGNNLVLIDDEWIDVHLFYPRQFASHAGNGEQDSS